MKDRALFWLLAAAFVLRAGISFPALFSGDLSRWLRPDSALYLEGMRQLAGNGVYRVAERAPGFAAFSAGIWKASGSLVPVALALIFVGTATLVFVYLAAREYGSREEALAATGLGAFHITLIANTPLMLSDTLFGFFAAAEFFFTLAFWSRKRFRDAAFAGVAGGIGALIRPINAPHFVVLALLFAATPGATRKKRGIAVLLALGFFASASAPWMYRNFRCGTGFAVDANTGAMLHQNGAMLQAEIRHTSFEEEKRRLLAMESAAFADREKFPDAASREKFRMACYGKMIARHPFVALKQQFFNAPVLLPDAPTALELLGVTRPGRGTMDVLARDGLFAAVRHYFHGRTVMALLPLAPFVLTAFAVLFYAAKHLVRLFLRRTGSRRDILLFGGFALYYLWLPGAITAPRYQIPALPILLCFAAAGLLRAGEKKRRGTPKNACKSPAEPLC
ncbi:MAG: glycosyltransferase family 39 protein [Victivallaceae bacterium]|nr:glycosyltransferase family 39 protein [Victivallaceae bacterium]